MGTSTPSTTPTNGQQIVLPPGVSIQPGRQTSQTTGAWQVVQGTLYGLVLANGTASSVFVPDSTLGNIPAIQALFDQRISSLSAIPVG